MEKYTIESLIPLNYEYHSKHRVIQDDVDMANRYKEIIEKSRTANRIQPGDIVELTNKYGNYYCNAHFERLDVETDLWSVCEQPQIPFISFTEDKSNIKCSTSGGAWTSLQNNLKLIGKRKKYFKDWGHCRACANGAVTFEATVNVWEYVHPEPMHGEHTTKHYDKHFISFCVDEKGQPKGDSPYRYFGDGIAFATKEDYSAWRDTFRGVEFKGHWPNQTIVFTYKRVEKLISKEAYDALDLPVDTRMCNGTIEVKVIYDDEARTVTEYRWTNCGSELARKRIKPYILARQAITHISY